MSDLNRTVAEYYGKREIPEEVGVEIEVEASNNIPDRSRFEGTAWIRVRDGSLRGYDNAEFVFDKPLKEKDALKAVDLLTKRLSRNCTDVVDSVRAGVHIHINMRSMTMKQLWTFVTCYYILEETLTDFCGEGRQGNHFCLRAMDADSVVYKVTRAIQGDIRMLGDESIRYSALNFNALRKFGSLEFRALRTPTDFEKIKTWVEVLMTLKRNSMLYQNPESVVANFSGGGEEAFMRAMLGKHVGNFEIDSTKLRRGVCIAQDVAYAREWD